MAKKVKCPTCDKLNSKSEVVDNKHNRRYYCNKCYDELMDRLYEEGCTKDDYNNLYDYIELMYNKKPDGQIFQQIKRYKDEYNYTYYWMRLTLEYVFEIEKLPVQRDGGIGIIPYYYSRAQKYFNDIWDIMDKNDEVELNKINNTKQVNVSWND